MNRPSILDRRKEPRDEIINARAELFAEGKIVRVLDPDGKPKNRNGQQVWKAADDATPEELAYWRRERLQ